MYTTKEKWELMNTLEAELTEICIKSDQLIPEAEDMPRVRAIADSIFSLSEGKNEVIFDKEGRPSVVINFPCTEKASLKYLSASGANFDVPSSFKDKYLTSIAPAFVVKGKAIRGFKLGKYPDVINPKNGKNYHCSLYGLAPAWGGGDTTESYNGLADACDRINAGSYAEGVAVHNITRAEFCYLSLLSAVEGFQCRGANYYTKDGSVQTEMGAPCGYKHENQYIHVLTGSGPLAWRHDGTPFGLWGMNGPTYNILHGYMTKSGEWLFLENNDAAAMPASDIKETSDKYKALLPDGSLVAPGTAGTLKYDYKEDPGESGSKPFEICTELLHQQTVDSPYGEMSTSELTAREGVSIPLIAQLLLCAPLKKNTPRGYTYMRNKQDMVRVAWAGATWRTGSTGGWGRFNGYYYSPSLTTESGFGRVASLDL